MKNLILICTAAAGSLAAQDVLTIAGAPPQEATVAFIAAEHSSIRHPGPVKNAPYTADAESEFTQTLADGTRIQRKSSSKMARDSQGRTRTEHSNPGFGPMNVEMAPMAMIHDPVAKETIMLNEKEKTARKMKLPELPPRVKNGAPNANGDVIIERNVEVRSRTTRPAPEGVAGERVMFEAAVPAPPMAVAGAPMAGNMIFFRGGKDQKREPLGKQTISGVVCDGTRVTSTIPAGEIGNDRAIQIVSEEWFSAELQTTVMTKSSDPMHGENIFRLTNVKRAEPDKSLFEIPAGYTVKEDGPPMMLRKMERTERKQQ